MDRSERDKVQLSMAHPPHHARAGGRDPYRDLTDDQLRTRLAEARAGGLVVMARTLEGILQQRKAG